MYASYKTKNKYIEEIIEKYSDMVYRLAMARTRNEESAQEVFQEVFLRLSRKLPDFQSEEHEKAWLIKVTINCSKTFLMNKWRNVTLELPENLPAEEIQIKEIYDTVMTLPQKYRTVIHLFYYEDMSLKQIANILGINENTVKTRLLRAREKLKIILKGGFENE